MQLSQILVVSGQSDLGDHAHAMAGYYDILIKHAFGNYTRSVDGYNVITGNGLLFKSSEQP